MRSLLKESLELGSGIRRREWRMESRKVNWDQVHMRSDNQSIWKASIRFSLAELADNLNRREVKVD